MDEVPHGENGNSALQRRVMEAERITRALRVHSSVSQVVLHATTEAEAIQHTCQRVVDVGDYCMAWIGYANQSIEHAVRPVCAAGHVDGYLETLTAQLPVSAPSGMAIRTRQPAFIDDLTTVTTPPLWCREALKRGYRSCMALPLISDGQFVGIFTLYRDRQDSVLPEETQILMEMAANLAYGILSFHAPTRRTARMPIGNGRRGPSRRQYATTIALRHGAATVQQTHDELDRFFNLSLDLLCIADTDGHFRRLNPSWVRTLGYTRQELMAGTFYDFLHPDDVAVTREAIAKLAPQSRVIDFVNRYRCRNGSYRRLEWRSITTGKLIYAVARDITDRLQTEETLRDSEEQFRALFQRSPIPMAIYRDSGAVEYLNDRFVETFGYTLEDFSNVDNWWPLAYRDPQYRRDVMATWRQAVEKAAREHADIEPHEYRITAKDGSMRTVEIFGTKIGNRNLAIWNDITERKCAEDALRQSEALLRAIFDAALDVAFVVTDVNDDAPIVLEFSPGAERLFGYTRAEMVGHPVNPLHRPADVAQFPVAHRTMREGKKGFSGETVLIRKDGSEFPALFSTYPLFDDKGDMHAALGITIDITELKRTEDALRASEERLSLVIRNSPDLIFILDQSLRYIWTPKTVMNILPEGAVGKTDHDIFDEEEANRLDAINRQVMATGESTQYDITLSLPQGQQYYENSALPWRDAQGQIVGIVVYAHNITERKLTEQSLIREQAFLAAAIELLPFPILFVTPTREVIRQNRAYAALQDMPNSGDLFGGIQLLSPQTRRPLPLREWPILDALRGRVMPSTEWILRQPNGHEIPILLQTAPITVNGTVVAAVVAFQDISALKEADRAKNQFLMVLSHEVKTPLTSIIGWAQMAQNSPDIVPQALQTIVRNAYAQKRLLERLLVLSRILTGKLALIRKPVDLWQRTLDAAKDYEQVAEQRKITITLQPPSEDLPLSADAGLIEQAIREVIDNAIHFTPDHGAVTITGHRDRRVCALTIHDTGQGMTPEQLSLLTKPFIQLERSEEIGGLGIGLALARGVIEYHGGKVKISSAGIGHGTTVTLALPCAST